MFPFKAFFLSGEVRRGKEEQLTVASDKKIQLPLFGRLKKTNTTECRVGRDEKKQNKNKLPKYTNSINYAGRQKVFK